MDRTASAPRPLRIGSEQRTTEATETILSPYDGTEVGVACVGGPSDMDDAIAAADEAFGITRRLSGHARIEIARAVAAGLRGRAEEFATLITRESGKPIRFSRGEVARAVTTFELAAAAVAQPAGEVLPVDLQPGGEDRLCLHERVPRGPVAAISPFNFPLNLVAHKLAPALAVGTSVVLKPPPQCPLTAFALGDLMAEAGLPDGALNIVHCSPGTAQRMVEDDRLKVLSFTGSDTVGWKLKSLAGRKQVLLELGGNAPCVLDAGTDLDAALPALLNGAWAHAGQVCIKVQRILVQRDSSGPFLERFVAETEALACGDPMDPDTVVGPVIEEQHAARVLAWIEEARAQGAELHCGGVAEGNVVRPTVLTGVPREARVCRDEVFGPVTVVEPFDTFDEALEVCNAGRFGLQAGIFTQDVGRALQAYRTLDYGGVLINDVPTFRTDNLPYGGVKDSGFGREGVNFAIEEMSEPKVLILRGLGG